MTDRARRAGRPRLRSRRSGSGPGTGRRDRRGGAPALHEAAEPLGRAPDRRGDRRGLPGANGRSTVRPGGGRPRLLPDQPRHARPPALAHVAALVPGRARPRGGRSGSISWSPIPGNATDGEHDEGIVRNARGIAESLEAVEAPTRVLLELTAGSGTSVGGSFERPARHPRRASRRRCKHAWGCASTRATPTAQATTWSTDYDGVWAAFDDALGLEPLGLIHLNDSKHPLGLPQGSPRDDRRGHAGHGAVPAPRARRAAPARAEGPRDAQGRRRRERRPSEPRVTAPAQALRLAGGRRPRTPRPGARSPRSPWPAGRRRSS